MARTRPGRRRGSCGDGGGDTQVVLPDQTDARQARYPTEATSSQARALASVPS
jgi:hypothetical protein